METDFETRPRGDQAWEAERMQRVREGCVAASADLFHAHVPLLCKFALGAFTRFSDWSPEEAIAEANLAFFAKLNQFDPSRGRLTTFLYQVLPRELERRYRETCLVRTPLTATKNKHSPCYRKALAAMSVCSLDGMLGEEYAGGSAESLETLGRFADDNVAECALELDRQEALEVLREEIQRLPLARREVLISRVYEGKTLREIGDERGVTRERVRQIELQARKELRIRLEQKGLGQC